MAKRQSRTVLRRKLGQELRALRRQQGLTCLDVSRKMKRAVPGGKWSESKVSRIETAHVSVHHGDVSDLLDLYQVGAGAHRDAIMVIARDARMHGWWHSYVDVLPSWFEIYVDLETDASIIRSYQNEVVPGLLQTEDYARALLSSHPVPESDAEIDRRVKLRLARQALLTRKEPPQYWVVLNEGMLRRQVGGRKVMREQLSHLLAAAESPNIMIQVLSYESGAHAGLSGPFDMLEFPDPDDPRIVHVDHLTGGLYLEKLREVGHYSLAFEHLRVAALGTSESAEVLRHVIAEM